MDDGHSTNCRERLRYTASSTPRPCSSCATKYSDVNRVYPCFKVNHAATHLVYYIGQTLRAAWHTQDAMRTGREFFIFFGWTSEGENTRDSRQRSYPIVFNGLIHWRFLTRSIEESQKSETCLIFSQIALRFPIEIGECDSRKSCDSIFSRQIFENLSRPCTRPCVSSLTQKLQTANIFKNIQGFSLQ